MSNLANLFLKATFNPTKRIIGGGQDDALALRTKLCSARRFVLDTEMSGFMSDLACAFFGKISSPSCIQDIGGRAVEDARRLALLPFDVTWIEYDGRAQHRHALAQYADVVDLIEGAKNFLKTGEDEVCPVEGWLCWKDTDQIFHAQVISALSGDKCGVLPIRWHWRIDDQPTGWHHLGNDRNGYTTSQLRPWFGKPIANTVLPVGFWYDTDKIGFTIAPWAINYNVAPMIASWKGNLRYLLALLACINSDSVPTLKAYSPRPSGWFSAGGQSRALLDFTTVTIKLPKNVSSAKYAARIVKRIRHRRHEVRSFLRKDRQGVKRILVHSHFRGDASLGWVVHERYDVKAALDNKKQPA
jgi:hypothetical protein